MNIPTPPWYDAINKKLERYEWLVDAILVGIVVLCVLALLRGDRLQKTALAVWFMSP